MTDARGRFALSDVIPEKTFVLVQQPGFRFQGWPVDPKTQSSELQLTLVRTSETPDRTMTVLAEPIPPDKARALADRLLEPYLQQRPAKASSSAMSAAIRALSTFDLDRALDLFQKGIVQDQRSANSLRAELAQKLVDKDPAAAQALIEPISDSALRAQALVTLAKRLPVSKRDQKLKLLEKAAPLVHEIPNAAAKIPQIAAIAETWLDLGEIEKGRPFLEETVKTFDAIPYAPRSNNFLTQLMRVAPGLALPRIQKVPTIQRFLAFADIAPQFTLDNPAEAEFFYSLGGAVKLPAESTRQCGFAVVSLASIRRVPRRLAASLDGPGERVCAWAFVALGLAEKDQTAAREALDRAVEGIDRLRELGTTVDPGIVLQDVRVIYPTNPAALILPLVERIAPERLAEVFWRAVELHPQVDINRDDLLRSSFIGDECMLLARYDRDVAAVLFEPMDSYLRSLVTRKNDAAIFTPSAITGKACLDPRAAVTLLESLPEPRGPFTGAHWPRTQLAEALGQPPEERWKTRWSHLTAQLPIDD